MNKRMKLRALIANFATIRPRTRDKTFSMSCPLLHAFTETRICPDAGVIFFMFQRGLGLATEPARMTERLAVLSNPRFSLFERPLGRLRSVTKTSIKQGILVNSASDRLQRCQILSRDQRNPKGAFWCEKMRVRTSDFCEIILNTPPLQHTPASLDAPRTDGTEPPLRVACVRETGGPV